MVTGSNQGLLWNRGQTSFKGDTSCRGEMSCRGETSFGSTSSHDIGYALAHADNRYSNSDSTSHYTHEGSCLENKNNGGVGLSRNTYESTCSSGFDSGQDSSPIRVIRNDHDASSNVVQRPLFAESCSRNFVLLQLDANQHFTLPQLDANPCLILSQLNVNRPTRFPAVDDQGENSETELLLPEPAEIRQGAVERPPFESTQTGLLNGVINDDAICMSCYKQDFGMQLIMTT